MLFRHVFASAFCLLICFNTYCIPSKFRLTGIGDLSTEMTLIFDTSFDGDYQTETKPKVYYSTSYSMVNSLSSHFVKPNDVNTNSEMRNNICRLTNLDANTRYYFKVADDQGVSDTYHFETLPSGNSPLSIIAGGDSRSNRSPRVSANKMVAKLKPHAVLFTGDFTDYGSPENWQWWFEDWQYTIDNSNRIVPIIPTRGNHEPNDGMIVDLFGAPEKVYYTSTNNSLLTVITLNSEKAISSYGAQTSWLQNTLSETNTTYKIAQYHKPMRPHVQSKLEGAAQYAYWANIFEDYHINLVVESDSHTSKTTWPIVVCTGGLNCDEGFKRDDTNGVVYTGEGCWGAPIRQNNDDKIWTRSSGMYNQFKHLIINEYGIELRTVLVDREPLVSEVDINNRFYLPPNQTLWTTGEVVFMQNKNSNTFPTVTLDYPTDNALLDNLNPILLRANATDKNGSIKNVSFYVNGLLVNTDYRYPYQYNFNPLSYGQYQIHVIATDNAGLTSCIDMAAISLVNQTTFTNTSKINTTTDDAEEYSNGHMDLFNWDIDLGYNGYTCGFRFQNVNIPPRATVTNAYIQFTADEMKDNTTSLDIFGEKNANAKTFFFNSRDISNRTKTSNSVLWFVNPWSQVGASGINESTPNLKNIMNEIIALEDYALGNPFVFIITGSGYRVSETYDGDSIKAAVLHYTYTHTLEDEPEALIEVWPGDADNNGIVNSKDILYICLGNNTEGPARLNANTFWGAQPVAQWFATIAGVEFAHQDADGDGDIDIDKDIAVVKQNYGKQKPNYAYDQDQPGKILKLQQVSASENNIAFDLVIESNEEVWAHGIHGSIDFSEFLKSKEDTVKIDLDIKTIFGTINSFYSSNIVFTKYHKNTKVFDFSISSTNKRDMLVNNTSLFRINIETIEPLVSGATKKATLNNSGILSAERKYEPLKGSTYYVIDPDNKFNIVTTQPDCAQNGTAEIQVFNDNPNAYRYHWSNGMSGLTTDNLEAGNYTLTINDYNDEIKIAEIDFEIESGQNISEIVVIDEGFTKDTVVKASKEISMATGVEMSNSYNVELVIESCNSN